MGLFLGHEAETPYAGYSAHREAVRRRDEELGVMLRLADSVTVPTDICREMTSALKGTGTKSGHQISGEFDGR